jgi:DNA-binding PadR family transcriptional regulator
METTPNGPEPRFLQKLALALALLVFSPIILILLVYELLPHRRAQIQRFTAEALSALAREGELAGRDLRRRANARARTHIDSGTFYCRMRRLEEAGHVTSREEERDGGLARLFSVTRSGRHLSVEIQTPADAAKTFLGGLCPA